MTAPSVVTNVNSRFRILDTPIISPGKCAVCGAVNRPVVDFGLNIQRYGAVMLCVDCICEGAERVGMIRPEQLEDETLQTGQSVEAYLSERNLKVITNELYDLLTGIVSLSAAGLAIGPNGVPDSVDDESSEVPSGQLELDFSEPESFDL